MDSESLDRCIQKVLAALYPPFQATSPSLLAQVLSVVDSSFTGDGLRYLIHFLLPSKQLLQLLQQEACSPFSGLLFRHEGWPLCIHEKIVVQLCALDQHLLHPGDFYLLVSAAAAAGGASCRSSVSVRPRLLLCSVSVGGRHVEQQEVPVQALTALFSMAWLDSVNRDRERRGAARLERCVLQAHGDVFRVPWEDVVHPQFITRPQNTSTQGSGASARADNDPDRSRMDVKLLPFPATASQSAASSDDSEGEYVELTELPAPPRFSPQKGSLTQSISLQHRARTSAQPDGETQRRRSSEVRPATPPAALSSHTLQCSRLLEETFSLHRPPGVQEQADAESCTQRPEGKEDREVAEEEGDEEAKNRRCEGLESVGGEKQELQLKGRKGRSKEEEGEREEGERNETELEEVQSQERKEEEVMKGHQKEVGEVAEKETGHEEYIDIDVYSESNRQMHSEDSYSENGVEKFTLEVSCCKNTTENIHPEDFYCESITEKTKRVDACCRNITENILPGGSYSEKLTREANLKDIYSENISKEMHPEGSYCENMTQPTHPEDFQCKTNPVTSAPDSSHPDGSLHTPPEDSYFEIGSLQRPSSELQPINSAFPEMFKILPQVHKSEDYFENLTQQTQPEDSYSEKHIQPKDSYSENEIQPKDCYFENQEQSEDFYCENLKQPTDSYSESATLVDSKKQKQPNDSYCENQIKSEDSYFENQKQLQDSYSESTTLVDSKKQKQPKDAENQIKSEDSYFENQEPPEDSSFEKQKPAEPTDFYSENTTHAELVDSYCEKQIQPADSNCEDPAQSEEDQTALPHPVFNEGQEEEEEQDCDKNVGRRSSDDQTEGSSCQRSPVQLHPGAGSEEPVAGPTQSPQSRFYSVLLGSGAVCLPGTRDRAGRALLTVSACSPVWADPDCHGAELLRLLRYYTSTLRAESRAKGLTVVVDARGAAPGSGPGSAAGSAPGSALLSALRALQEDSPGSIHTVLVLATKDSSLRLDRAGPAQVEVLSSLKSLQRHVELQQLPAELGGSLSFSQSSWISFRRRVEQLTTQCSSVIDLLQDAISNLQSTPLPAVAEDAEPLLSRCKLLMCCTLEDVRLVRLQQEGGASLAWLRREGGGGAAEEEQRAAVETVSALYDQVDELLHRLVTLSNSRTQELRFIQEFRSLEQGFSQVRLWLDQVGEVQLKTLNEPADSLDLLNQKLQDFKEFHTTAYDHCKRGEVLLARLERWDDVSSPQLHSYEVKVHAFWAQLQDFSQRVKGTGQNIERAVQLYRFLDQAYGWAMEGARQLDRISTDDCLLPDKCRAVIGCLEDYRLKHPPIPESRFQEMKAEAGELRGERGLCQWSFAWSKCQEAEKTFHRKMEAALRTRDSAHRHRSNSVISISSASSRKSGLWGISETSASPPTPQRTPFFRRLLRSSSSYEESERPDASSSPSLPPSSSSSSRRQQLRKTQSFDCPPTPDASRCAAFPRTLSEPPRRGNTGVFIRGLEVSSTEAADRTLCPRTPAQGWAAPRSAGTPAGSPGASPGDGRPRGSKLRHIVEEMVTTEREYVRSLQYIIRHYFPEMEQADLPQDLRGKRSIIFGNLEKLLDFHSQFFLSELEACWRHPLRVPHCFLRHQEQFRLYALYSKNKPKSDALLAHHGHAFFRRKQLELGDKMDLSSYLLKPIQRMSKYALLLSDLIKEVGVAQEAELAALQDATNMVKFQLRHGNDLLAMDAIRNCEVDLKEQGQLIRQDEFTVWSGRRKCQRRIFLFQEMVLFSKPKKMEGGLDVFIYKHSFKTAEVGLTESSGDNGLRFEVWFRRRTAKNQTFVLQAASPDIKRAWTGDLARILWTQAARNKETRLKEMVSMGVGNKPFLDIQPSDAAISDRAVHYIMKARGARTRASIAVSAFDHAHPFQRGGGGEAAASGPSSCSLLGSLNLHMFSQALPSAPPADASFCSSCIEEDEQEHETSSQPSMTTESSGSSSHCLSGSTGSDSGCVSSHLQEALQGEPSASCRPPSSSSNQHQDFLSPKTAAVVSPATTV